MRREDSPAIGATYPPGALFAVLVSLMRRGVSYEQLARMLHDLPDEDLAQLCTSLCDVAPGLAQRNPLVAGVAASVRRREAC